jgi:Spy/CpxP family protein refolding chaperone
MKMKRTNPRAMSIMCTFAAAMLSATTVGATARAQQVDRLQQAPPGAQPPGGALERQFRERFAEVVRRRLNLNDSQMQRLGQVNDRFERDRMLLLREERRTRQALRAEVLAGDSADQAKVSGLLDELLKLQRRRLDVTESEQKELSAFMSPTQRAKYFGIQDELRQRLESLRQQRQQQRRGQGRVGPGRPLP